MVQTVTQYKPTIIYQSRWIGSWRGYWDWREYSSFPNSGWRMYKQYDYAPYSRRRLPSIPLLSPTSQRKVGWIVNLGEFGYTTRTYESSGQLNYYVLKRCQWKHAVHPILNLDYLITGKMPVVKVGNDYMVIKNLEAVQEAQTKLLNELKDQTLNLSISVAEGKETMSWLSHRATSMYNILKGVKKGRWADVRKGIRMGMEHERTFVMRAGRLRVEKRSVSDMQARKNLFVKQPKGWSTKDVSDRYLEVHYAAAPLIGELAGAMALMHKYFTDSGVPRWHFAKGTVKRTWSEKDTLIPWFWPLASGGSPGKPPGLDLLFESTVWYKSTALFTINSEWKRRINQTGLTATGILQGGYEIVPWSFVLDWGVGIGDYLSALDATVGLDFETGWDVRFAKGEMTSANLTTGDATLFEQSSAPFGRLRAVSRDVMTSWPRPFVTVKSPFSFSHVTTAAALCRSLKSS